MDREKGSWLACGRSKENTFLARGLIEGHEYRYRFIKTSPWFWEFFLAASGWYHAT